MQYFRGAMSYFNVGSPKLHSRGQKRHRPSVSTSGEDQTRNVRRRETRVEEDPPTMARRRSKFGMPTLGSSSKSKTIGETTGERVPDRRKSVKELRREEELQALLQERQQLVESISRWNQRVDRRKTRLESLRVKDDGEKWEDELFETRMKELASARAVIHTQSFVNGEDVLAQIKALNHEIIEIAKIAAAVSIQKPAKPLEDISQFLGENLLLFFQRDDNHLSEPQVVQAVLQIFLAESCMVLIDSWDLARPNLDDLLHRLYKRIRSKEEQAVAGKWRQLTLTQLHNDSSSQTLRKYATARAHQLMAIAAAAGRGGDAQAVEQRVQKLMEEAGSIKMNVKVGIISADLQPWTAKYGAIYGTQEMVEASRSFGLATPERTEGCHVLGSTELGLRVHKKDDDSNTEFKGLRSRPRVLLVESFWSTKRSHRNAM